jgi:hypothetical protein
MNESYTLFIESQTNENTKRVARSLSAIGEYDFTNIDLPKLEDFIVSLKPKSKKTITTDCYMLSKYAEFTNNDNLVKLVKQLDRNILWERAKPFAEKKYLSYAQFKKVMRGLNPDDPDEDFEQNALYYQTLFWCIYEGIYNDDMSVIKNLRASDINNNVITLREDNGNVYDITVPVELVENLKTLSNTSVWQRRAKGGSIALINIKGIYEDSCFKAEQRTKQVDYRIGYFVRLRKITKTYFDYSVTPLQIYISGIMHRISMQLKEKDIELEYAFKAEGRNKAVHTIISDELTRCNCDTPTKNFREMVDGHLEVFEE